MWILWKNALVGVAQYNHLKKLYEEQNGTIDMVYMIYGVHEQFYYLDERSIEVMKEMHYKITHFAKKYFNQTNSYFLNLTRFICIYIDTLIFIFINYFKKIIIIVKISTINSISQLY